MIKFIDYQSMASRNYFGEKQRKAGELKPELGKLKVKTIGKAKVFPVLL